MIRTIEEFKKQAKEKNITRWDIHDCSMCGYWCGYEIRGDIVTYDSGCDCVWGGEHTSSWEELAESYNQNTPEKNPLISEKYTKETDDFWGFNKLTINTMEEKELTFGEKAVGLTFNPGNNPEVDKVKKLYADIIDGLNEIKNSEIFDTEAKRLASIAITEAQGAQMWAVKAITWK